MFRLNQPPKCELDAFDIEAMREGNAMRRAFKIKTPSRRKGRARNRISPPPNANRKVA